MAVLTIVIFQSQQPGHIKQERTCVHSENILLQDWKTPFKMPPFGAVRDEDFLPAFEDAMRTHLAEVDAIANKAEEPSFGNTVEALEKTGAALQQASSVFFNLASADTNDERQKIERTISPLLTKHSLTILTNSKLFDRIDRLFQSRDSLGLAEEQSQLLENYHKRFVRAGARLGPEAKARLKQIGARLSELSTAFAQNVLADEKAFQLILEGEDDLKGLPDFVRQAAAKTANDRNSPGKYVFTLSRASIEPFLEFSERRDLREKVYKAYVTRGEQAGSSDNRPLIQEI